jgi:hypothetical protein
MPEALILEEAEVFIVRRIRHCELPPTDNEIECSAVLAAEEVEEILRGVECARFESAARH